MENLGTILTAVVMWRYLRYPAQDVMSHHGCWMKGALTLHAICMLPSSGSGPTNQHVFFSRAGHWRRCHAITVVKIAKMVPGLPIGGKCLFSE